MNEDRLFDEYNIYVYSDWSKCNKSEATGVEKLFEATADVRYEVFKILEIKMLLNNFTTTLLNIH